MLKKTITYEDYNGEKRTEDFYFNLSKAEIIELQLQEEGGYAEKLQAIAQEMDGKQLIAKFKELILMSYGQKSPDGRRFIKNDELRDEFSQSEAYSTLFMELATDADAASEFANGLLPKGLVQDAEKAAERLKEDGDAPTELQAQAPVAPHEDSPIEEPSQKDLLNMTKEELVEQMRRKSQQ